MREGVQNYLFCHEGVFSSTAIVPSFHCVFSDIPNEISFNDCEWLLLVFISLNIRKVVWCEDNRKEHPRNVTIEF